MRNFAFIPLLIIGISACKSTEVVGPSSPAIPIPDNTGIKVTSYDAKSDTFTIVAGGHSIKLTRDGYISRKGKLPIKAYSDGLDGGSGNAHRTLPEFALFQMKSSSGKTKANFAVRTGNVNVQGYPNIERATLGGTFTHQTVAELPTSGTATMHGSYIGAESEYYLEIQGSHKFAEQLIHGKVHLTADFKDGSISGAITDRIARSSAVGGAIKQNVADVVLESTAIASSGLYEGVARTDGGSGIYNGALSGPDADETVGYIEIKNGSGPIRNEYGVFLAEQP